MKMSKCVRFGWWSGYEDWVSSLRVLSLFWFDELEQVLYAKHKLVGEALTWLNKNFKSSQRRFIFDNNMSLLFIAHYQFHQRHTWLHHSCLGHQLHKSQMHWVSACRILQHSYHVSQMYKLHLKNLISAVVHTFFIRHPDLRHLCFLCYHPHCRHLWCIFCNILVATFQIVFHFLHLHIWHPLIHFLINWHMQSMSSQLFRSSSTDATAIHLLVHFSHLSAIQVVARNMWYFSSYFVTEDKFIGSIGCYGADCNEAALMIVSLW